LRFGNPFRRSPHAELLDDAENEAVKHEHDRHDRRRSEELLQAFLEERPRIRAGWC
jgi:hypothetical protein